MNRIIVDYKKLTPEILNLLVEKFPDGYGIRDIIKFTNPKGQYVEAVEVRTAETIYLVKISDELVDSMDNHEDEDEEDVIISDDLDIKIDNSDLDIKIDDPDLDIDDEDDDIEEEEDLDEGDDEDED
ncbi:DNA primase [Lutibacter sp.]|uniref:DNA primase n=1 Tax=Lutibacter sp. TaxID=1925666 RepID=UPI001A1F650C|nr:DNA primase [Lutibacter sp.]MBI9042387.1 DNA primase [Lutibacter sp.]